MASLLITRGRRKWPAMHPALHPGLAHSRLARYYVSLSIVPHLGVEPLQADLGMMVASSTGSASATEFMYSPPACGSLSPTHR